MTAIETSTSITERYLAASDRSAARSLLCETARQLLDKFHLADGPPAPIEFGAEGAAFLNTAALTDVLKRTHKGSRTMKPERQSRIQSAMETLRRFLDHKVPAARTIYDASAALAECHQQTDEFDNVLRAIRVARLEAESAYDEAVHDGPLRRFGWRSAKPEERAAMPVVGLTQSAAQFGKVPIAQLAEIIGAGLPLHVLVSDADPLLAALIGGQRDVFVLIAAPQDEDFLNAGLKRMAAVTGPAIALIGEGLQPFVTPEAVAESAPLPVAKTEVPPVPQIDEQAIVNRTVWRLVAALLPGGAPIPSDTVPSTPAAPQTPTSTQAETPQAYIESSLCTSCNDCIKVNSRMFQYNENKQAFITDLSAGTFSELVKAGEGCPAKCIHPGTPRPGDRTATKEMLARAAKLQ